MGSNQPLVSVVIPTYRRHQELKRACNGVLRQTYNRLEVIVVNDDPQSDLSCVRNLSHKLVVVNHEKNLGRSAARNTGIKRSQGKYLAFLDDDDLWLPEKLEKQVRVMERLSEEWMGVYSWYYEVATWEQFQKSGRKKLVKSHLEGEITYDLLTLNPRLKIGAGSSLLVRRKTILQAGGFNESLFWHEEWDFLIRLLKFGKLKLIREPLWFRIGGHPPPVQESVRIKKQYLRQQKDVISRFDETAVKKIYANQWLAVACLWFKEGNIPMGLRYLRIALGDTPFVPLAKYLSLVKSVIKGQLASLGIRSGS